MKGYYKITLKVRCYNHATDVMAMGRGLLAIHPPVASVEEGYKTPTRNVTHIPTGFLIGVFSSIRVAQRALDQLLPLVDWATINENGITLSQRKAIQEVLEKEI